MRCPDCNKFTGLELQDPEDVELEIDEGDLDDDGEVRATVRLTARIVRNCEECGQELKEASIEGEDEILVDVSELSAADKHTKKVKDKHKWLDGHGDLTIVEMSAEQLEEGGGRYAKSYFGATVSYEVRCKCGEALHEGEISAKVAASAMDELV